MTEPTRGTETSQYPEEKKENSISPVAASEQEIAQTPGFGPGGCGAVATAEHVRGSGWKAARHGVTVPYPKATFRPDLSPSSTSHVEPGVNPGGPSPKAKYSLATDS